MSVSWKKNFFCIDLSKYRLITIFWNSLPMIFKIRGAAHDYRPHHISCKMACNSTKRAWYRDVGRDHRDATLCVCVLAVSRRFCQTLKRLTSLNHLCQAARSVVHGADVTSQMLYDWSRVDLPGICKQTIYTMDKYSERAYEMIATRESLHVTSLITSSSSSFSAAGISDTNNGWSHKAKVKANVWDLKAKKAKA